jgi:hypothetical protein
MEYGHNPTSKLTFNFFLTVKKCAHFNDHVYALATCTQGIASSGTHNSPPPKKKGKKKRKNYITKYRSSLGAVTSLYPRRKSERQTNVRHHPTCVSLLWWRWVRLTPLWTRGLSSAANSHVVLLYETESVWWPNQLGEWKKRSTFPIL